MKATACPLRVSLSVCDGTWGVGGGETLNGKLIPLGS